MCAPKTCAGWEKWQNRRQPGIGHESRSDAVKRAGDSRAKRERARGEPAGDGECRQRADDRAGQADPPHVASRSPARCSVGLVVQVMNVIVRTAMTAVPNAMPSIAAAASCRARPRAARRRRAPGRGASGESRRPRSATGRCGSRRAEPEDDNRREQQGDRDRQRCRRARRAGAASGARGAGRAR